MSDDKRWIVVVPEQAVSAESEADAVGLVYALGLAGVAAEAREAARAKPALASIGRDRVAARERRAGPQLGALSAFVCNEAALDAAVSRAWSVLDSAVDGYPAGYAWLHDAVREARDAVGEIGELLRAEAPTSDPPTVTPDAALAVMVAMDRGAEEGEPTASRAGIDEPVVLPPGHLRTTGPWEPGGDDDYDDDDDPSPWRPLPDPKCPEGEDVLLSYGAGSDRAVAIARWERNQSGPVSVPGVAGWWLDDQWMGPAEAHAWMPLPEPWRGGA